MNSTKTQTTREQEKSVCHSQGLKHSQTSQLCRDGARQLVVVEAPCDCHKHSEQRETDRESARERDVTSNAINKTHAKHVCYSQECERSQPAKLCRDRASQSIVVKLTVGFSERRER